MQIPMFTKATLKETGQIFQRLKESIHPECYIGIYSRIKVYAGTPNNINLSSYFIENWRASSEKPTTMQEIQRTQKPSRKIFFSIFEY